MEKEAQDKASKTKGPLQRWLNLYVTQHFRVGRERVGTILNDISDGSTPAAGYYALISAASLIAGIGLIANSTAVVIGAMLVSPLMTPIFGISLGMIRGNALLLGKAVRAEVGGVVLAIAFGAFLGTFPLTSGVTPEMLSRTEPTLLDLFVAVFAGFAGALALTNERISPALPGVAISTAIVPPLSTCGLCLAFGAYNGAYGALLLFAANFFAILLVSSVVFALAGLGAEEEVMPLSRLTARLVTAGIGFLIIALILTRALIGMVEERTSSRVIRDVLNEVIQKDPSTSLVDVFQSKYQKEMSILATIRTPKVLSPARVKTMEDKLQASLGLPLQLVVRCVLSRDVAPTGNTSNVISPTLDRTFLTKALDPDVRRIQLAEQTLREIFTDHPQLELRDTDLLYLAGDVVILATIQTPRPLAPLEVSEYESAIRRRIGDDSIRLLMRCIVTTDITSRGRVLFGKSHFGQFSEDAEMVEKLTRRMAGSTEDLFVTNVDAVKQEDRWNIRAEILGTRVMSPAEVKRIEQSVSEQVGQPVSLYVWSRVELMVTDSKRMPLEKFTEERLMSNKPDAELIQAPDQQK